MCLVFLVLELNCEFVGVKSVVICFEVDIIIRLITVLMSSADSDVVFLLFFCKYFNLNIQSPLVSARSWKAA